MEQMAEMKRSPQHVQEMRVHIMRRRLEDIAEDKDPGCTALWLASDALAFAGQALIGEADQEEIRCLMTLITRLGLRLEQQRATDRFLSYADPNG